jgi:hypothetical protein
MLQPDRLAPALDTPFVMALTRPRKAGLEEIMRGQRGKALGQHALRPDHLADGRGQIVVRHPLGHATERGKGPHVRIQQRQLIAAVIEPHKVIAGVHEAHEEFPGVPLLPAFCNHHIKKVHLRSLPRPIAQWDKYFGAL